MDMCFFMPPKERNDASYPFAPEMGPVLQGLRPVFHAASWESFLYLITGLLLGQAQADMVITAR